MSAARRYARSAIAGALLVGWLASGCGGGSKASAPAYPSYPSGAPAGGGAAPMNASPARPPSELGPPPPPSATAAPETPGTAPFAQPPPVDRERARVNARDELVRAENELEASSGRDCGTACRALASMQRATSRLCDLADSPDDRRRCDDARSRLADAEQRVRRACGICSDGKGEIR